MIMFLDWTLAAVKTEFKYIRYKLNVIGWPQKSAHQIFWLLLHSRIKVKLSDYTLVVNIDLFVDQMK